MNSSNKASRKQVLGEFIRHARERISPQQAGVTSYGRRRTPGLRREEVAQLCDISVTWYTWIEQGRDVAVSVVVWARLADVLNMTRAERAYLFELADVADPDHAKAQYGSLPNSIIRSLDYVNAPAYLLDRHWNIVAWNPAMNEVLEDWIGQQEKPNLLYFIFLDALSKRMVPDWDHRAQRAVAEFRADIGSHLDDIETRQLIEHLITNSKVFEYWWQHQSVVEREGGIRVFQHQTKGTISFEQVSYRVATQSDIKLVILLDKSVD